MTKRLHPFIIPAVLAITLTSCASTSEIDWDLAQNEANRFIETATDAEDSLGGGSLRVLQGTPGDDESGIVLNYASSNRIQGINVSCFGEGTIRIGFATQSRSSWKGSDSVEVLCDGAENAVPVTAISSMAEVDAIQFNGVVSKGSGGVLAVAISGVAI